MLGLAEFERGVCACGWHESLIEGGHFAIEERVCPVCAAGARYDRITEDSDSKWREALGENPPPDRKDPADGRSAFVRMKSPDEVSGAVAAGD